VKITKISFLLIILNNLIPFLGVIFLSWNVFEILFYFLAEGMVICFFTMIKIFISKKPETLPFTPVDIFLEFKKFKLKTQLQVKINALYLLCVFYIIFAGSLLLLIHESTGIYFPKNLNLLMMIIFPFIVHLISFFSNYISNKEYLKISPMQQIMKSLVRFIPVIIYVIVGAMFGQYGIMFMLVIAKTIIDYYSHIQEHSLVVKNI